MIGSDINIAYLPTEPRRCRAGDDANPVEQFEKSWLLYEEVGILPGKVRSLSGIAWAMGELGRPDEALAVARKALEMQRGDASATPERIRQALHQVIFRLCATGEYTEAFEACDELEAVYENGAPPLSALQAYEDHQHVCREGAGQARRPPRELTSGAGGPPGPSPPAPLTATLPEAAHTSLTL